MNLLTEVTEISTKTRHSLSWGSNKHSVQDIIKNTLRGKDKQILLWINCERLYLKYISEGGLLMLVRFVDKRPPFIGVRRGNF